MTPRPRRDLPARAPTPRRSHRRRQSTRRWRDPSPWCRRRRPRWRPQDPNPCTATERRLLDGARPARHTPLMRKRSNEVEIERDVKVQMPDGVVLLTDVYHPVGVDDAPTLLERTPYGRQAIAS